MTDRGPAPPVPGPRLLLLRHGESVWNQRGLFSGWVDVELSPRGRAEAAAAGALIAAAGVRPDVIHTSLLGRAIETAEIVAATTGRSWVPVRRSWRLNERHYGELQGKDRAAIRRRFGDERYVLWRRSFEAAPPPLPPDAGDAPGSDPRYRLLAPEVLPRSESLRDVLERLLPYWHDAIVPDLRSGALVLVSAHGNSLRALIKHLDAIADAAIPAVDLPTGIPLLYELDGRLRSRAPIDPRFGLSGRYLDPVAAAESIAAVARQGGPARGMTSA